MASDVRGVLEKRSQPIGIGDAPTLRRARHHAAVELDAVCVGIGDDYTGPRPVNPAAPGPRYTVAHAERRREGRLRARHPCRSGDPRRAVAVRPRVLLSPMRTLDWLVVVVYLVWIVYDGLRRSKGTDKVDGYFLANRSLPWWAVGPLGDGDADERRHARRHDRAGVLHRPAVHPVLLRPAARDDHPVADRRAVLHRAKVYTAYEYLERRFDVRVRSLASFLFLMGRAFSLGVTLAAPAVVMSAILGWQLPVTVLVICVPMILYTSLGGVQAVAWTDVKQMVIVVGGMCARPWPSCCTASSQTSASARRCTWPARRAGCRRSTSGSTCARPTRSGRG